MEHPRNIIRVLEALRWRLLRVAVLWLGAAAVAYWYTPALLRSLMATSEGMKTLIFLSPGEAFLTRIKLALAVGGVAISPIGLGHLVGAAKPVLRKEWRRSILQAIPICYFLFLIGVSFAYYAVLPLALRFFLGFGGDNLQPAISVGNLVSFLLSFVMPFGVIFQLPVAVLFLARLGLITPAFFARNRKYAVIIIFIIAAALTPADVFSQLLMAVPTLVLYEVSALLVRLTGRKKFTNNGQVEGIDL